MHESKFPFVSRIEFIRSKLSNFSAHVYGVTVSADMADVGMHEPCGERICTVRRFLWTDELSFVYGELEYRYIWSLALCHRCAGDIDTDYLGELVMFCYFVQNVESFD